MKWRHWWRFVGRREKNCQKCCWFVDILRKYIHVCDARMAFVNYKSPEYILVRDVSFLLTVLTVFTLLLINSYYYYYACVCNAIANAVYTECSLHICIKDNGSDSRWKAASISPVPKISSPASLSDFRPVSITSAPEVCTVGHSGYWVTLSFVETKVWNHGLKPKFYL